MNNRMILAACMAIALGLTSGVAFAGTTTTPNRSVGHVSQFNSASHNSNVGSTGNFTITHTPVTKNNGVTEHSTTITNTGNGNSITHTAHSFNYKNETIGHDRSTEVNANNQWFYSYRETDIGNLNNPIPTASSGATGVNHFGQVYYTNSTTGVSKENHETTTLYTAPIREIQHTGVTPNNPTGGTVVIPLAPQITSNQ